MGDDTSNDDTSNTEGVDDPDRLMDGEDPETTDPEEAEHWLGVYGELLGFKRRLVREAASGSQALSDDSLDEAFRDLSLLDRERRRLARRYLFWKERLADLRE